MKLLFTSCFELLAGVCDLQYFMLKSCSSFEKEFETNEFDTAGCKQIINSFRTIRKVEQKYCNIAFRVPLCFTRIFFLQKVSWSDSSHLPWNQGNCKLGRCLKKWAVAKIFCEKERVHNLQITGNYSPRAWRAYRFGNLVLKTNIIFHFVRAGKTKSNLV